MFLGMDRHEDPKLGDNPTRVRDLNALVGCPRRVYSAVEFIPLETSLSAASSS